MRVVRLCMCLVVMMTSHGEDTVDFRKHSQHLVDVSRVDVDLPYVGAIQTRDSFKRADERQFVAASGTGARSNRCGRPAFPAVVERRRSHFVTHNEPDNVDVLKLRRVADSYG